MREMVNSEGPSVPITTLAGVQNLTDLLLELPLPVPLPRVTGHQSLLSHLNDPEEATRLLNTQESVLVSPLVEALGCTGTDHIEVKDGYYGGGSHSGPIPQLVKYLLGRNPGLFKDSLHGLQSGSSNHVSSGHWLQRQCSTVAVHPQSNAFNAAVSPCQAHTAHGNSPGYLPLDHSPSPQATSIDQNNRTNAPPKSQLLYSPYDPAVSSSGSQNSTASLQSAPQGASNALSPDLIEGAQLYNSHVGGQPHGMNEGQTSAANHPQSNGNSSNHLDFAMVEDPSKPHVDAESHPFDIGNLMSNCSSFSTPVVPSEQSLLSSTSLPLNSLCVTSDTSHVPLPMTNPPLELRQPQQNTVVHHQNTIAPVQHAVVHHQNTTVHQPNSDSQMKSHPDIAPVCVADSQPKQETSPADPAKTNRGRGRPPKSNQTLNPLAAPVTLKDEPKSSAEPTVVLTKVSVEDQLLAQRSVKQFLKKHKDVGIAKTGGSANKTPEAGSRRRASPESDAAKSRKKDKNNDFFRPKSETGKDRGAKRSLDFSDGKRNSSEPTKKKRRGHRHQTYAESPDSTKDDDDSDVSFKEESPPQTPAVATTKSKKSKSRKLKDPPEALSVEDLMDTNTYQRFSRLVDVIFDAMEDVDFSAVVDDEADCPAEVLVPLSQLQELSNEAAKLKRLHAMNQFPPERLVRLLSILERNIIDGWKLLPLQIMEEQDDEESRLYLELSMERVMRSADSSLTALYVMTSLNMPEKVFLEDVIERIVVFLKYQIHNTIFPVFDPAYRLDPKSKDGYSGSIKMKRAHAHKVKEKSTLQLYNKLHESVSLMSELLDLQTLTDTIILQVSTLGVSPFFVEGISELQLNALRMVTTVFSRYEKHRQLILEDILASIARLPSSKRSLRSYRLNSEENIQMLTALVLQLIHSVVRLPEPEADAKENWKDGEAKSPSAKEKVYIDKDARMTTSYEASLTTAINFLTAFLKKCGTKNEEMDYRPLFEHFVQDLLSTVNKPEWPASELLLSVLGRILFTNFSNKSMEMTLRVASLDYLGVVAARLRKDAVTSQDRKEMINDVIRRIVKETEGEEGVSPPKSKKKHKKKSFRQDEIQILQKALLHYLDSNAGNDPALQFSRRFYICQWYRDAAAEIRRSDKSLNFPKEETDKADQTPVKKKTKAGRPRTSHRRSSQVSYEEEEEEEEEEKKVEKEEDEAKLESDEVDAKVLALAEERKRFLLNVIKKQEPAQVNLKEKEHIDYKTAELIAQYLASNRHFSKSFDLYLSQILRVLGETAVAVRTKAMKCLALVVEADPSILSRDDMQKGVHGRLLDQSTSVREAAVDLLGKFILIRPELISQYYEMLTDRVLDTGVSVRKRVIKILKDICVEHPDFPKTSEICVKIIRRVNDEDGIRKLVGEVFQSMWFTPAPAKKIERVLQKVKNITHVVEACHESGLEWFEQLLSNLLKNKEDANYESVVKSCKQIVDCLVESLLKLEESSQGADGGANPHLVACLATLHLFSRIYPPFVVPHATTIQPYLSLRCDTQSDFQLLKNVAQTLELVVPLMEHPSESFLAQIEEDIVKLILRQHMGLLPSCFSCLGAVVNKVTHNHQLVRDCFQKYFGILLLFKKEHEKNPENENLKSMRPKLLRSLYTVGLFCRHFDIDAKSVATEEQSQIDKVFEAFVYFNHHEDEVVRLKALTGLGFMMIRHYDFMRGPEVKELYHYLLTFSDASCILKCQVLKNITNYLVEEEIMMIQKDAEWNKTSKGEDLKEMGDVTSGMASTIIQVYLKQVMDCVLNREITVRKASLQVIHLILQQGLVHPVQIVPYLVCLGSDNDPVIRTKADQLLQEIEKKYPGFLQMRAIIGVRLSFQMQQLIHSEDESLRGFRSPDAPVSRNGFLYSAMRSTRQSRRAFLFSLLKLFDEFAKTPLTELLYVADNIAYFPYMAQDEPLFVMHQLDIMLSVSGSNLLQTFREALLTRNRGVDPSQPVVKEAEDYDEDDDDYDSILDRLPEDTSVLQECIVASQGCVLLLYLKQTLKEMYGFTDNKIQQYSPNENAKVYEKPLNRKGHVRYHPEAVLNFIETDVLRIDGSLDEKGKKQLVQQYIHFKQLMLTIDPADEDDEEGGQAKPAPSLVAALNAASAVVPPADGGQKTFQSPASKTLTPRKSRSPSRGRGPRRSPKPNKEKVKKKLKKKRRRIVDSESGESDSDPDYS